MKLLVSYGVIVKDIEGLSFVRSEKVIIEAPEDLLKANFYDYVIKNYYERIIEMEKDCRGSNQYVGVSISDIEFVVEMLNGLRKK